MVEAGKRWHAVQTRDTSFAGTFVYGVLTTGIFCRPGCPARTPRRENVRFYQAAHHAQADGLRPCLRCKPLAHHPHAANARFLAICTYIRHNLENSEALKLPHLSRRCNLSPFHFQRTFKATIGVTPKQYVEALRMQTLKQDLKTGSSVTGAIYSAGFASGSRVYARADKRLGMTPGQYRSGGKGVQLSYVITGSPLGLIMLAATGRGLCFLEFGSSSQALLASLRREYPAAAALPMQQPYSAHFLAWMQALAGYLEGESSLPPTPLSLDGTAFQLKVWHYLQTIPEGTIASYSKVAAAIGHPRAVRAVASACAANRLALVVPCHRVIRGDGALGGYRWGLDRKRSLLATEQRTALKAAAPPSAAKVTGQPSAQPSEEAEAPAYLTSQNNSSPPEQARDPAVDLK